MERRTSGPASDIIRSTANPLLKRARKLRQRKHRDGTGTFLAEGIQSVWQALEQRAPVEVILVSEDLLTSEAALELVRKHERRGVTVARLSGSAFETIAQREHPSGLAAIVGMERLALDDLAVKEGSLFVALHEVSNPGNLGSIIRTVDAIAGAGILLIGGSTDPWHPGAVKASMGTLFGVPVCRTSSEATLRWRERHRMQLVTTSAAGEHSYVGAAYRLPAIALFGSEGEGLPGDLVEAGDLCVRIPMSGAASSLNLAVSAGVLLYEIKRVVGDL
ncbi:MAG: RNA methyltransferase [Actinomycetota bacterium]|nr:RNA methyltransferase [Actinomycetota bacterium]